MAACFKDEISLNAFKSSNDKMIYKKRKTKKRFNDSILNDTQQLPETQNHTKAKIGRPRLAERAIAFE